MLGIGYGFSPSLNRLAGGAIGSSLQANYSYFYDGTNNLVSFGNVLNASLSGASPAFSVRMVIRRTGVGALQYMVSKINGTGDQRQFGLRFSATNTIEVITSSAGTAATNAVIGTTNAFSSTVTWYDIIWVFDGSQIGVAKHKIYVNGVSEAITLLSGTPGAIFASTANLKFGNIDGASQWLNGYSNQEGITSDLITAAEALTLYNGGLPKVITEVCDNVILSTIHNNDTFNGTNWTLIDDAAVPHNGTSSGMGAADRDANETPYP